MATAEQFSNELWRLNNLYHIKDKSGKKTDFRLNWAQKDFVENMWYKDVILKARQLGMTTFIQIFMLDRCLFNSNKSAGVIAHNKEDAQKFFKNIIKFAYECLPAVLRQSITARNDSAGELVFSNGSSIRVGTSLRSGTYQYLHISEFGKLCAKFPERASEVISGALNTVARDQFVFIESTAEGSYGRFFEMCKDAEEARNTSQPLTKMDYKFHFFPWWKHPDYVLHETVQITEKQNEYFNSLKVHGIDLGDERKAWYVKKEKEQKNKMKQEYPSIPAEAFETVSELAVYGEEIGEVIKEERLCNLPVNKSKPIDLFLDIGKSVKAETTSVWGMQDNDPWHDFILYYQAALKTVGAYVNDLHKMADDLGVRIGRWFIPHDANSQKDYEIKTFKDRLVTAGVDDKLIVVVAKIDSVKVGIDQMKEAFTKCRFDKERTKDGWTALTSYNYEWDEKRSIIGAPIHNWASHPSDAIRQYAQGYYPVNNIKPIKLEFASEW